MPDGTCNGINIDTTAAKLLLSSSEDSKPVPSKAKNLAANIPYGAIEKEAEANCGAVTEGRRRATVDTTRRHR